MSGSIRIHTNKLRSEGMAESEVEPHFIIKTDKYIFTNSTTTFIKL